MFDIKRLEDAITWATNYASKHVDRYWIDSHETTFPNALTTLIEDALQPVPECWQWSARLDSNGLRSLTLSTDISGDLGELVAEALNYEYPYLEPHHWYGGGCTLDIHLAELYDSLKDEPNDYDRRVYIPNFYEIWETEIDIHEYELGVFLDYGGDLMYGSGPVATVWQGIWTVATWHELARDLYGIMYEADVQLEVGHETTIYTNHRDADKMRDKLLDALFLEVAYNEEQIKEFKADLTNWLNN